MYMLKEPRIVKRKYPDRERYLFFIVITLDPLSSEVNADKCSRCGVCTPLCPYGAISMIGTNSNTRAEIENILCTWCGVCAATCPSQVIEFHGFTTETVQAQIITL